VRVLLEGNVYGLPYGNQDTIDFLREKNIPVYFSDPNRYTFTHAKFWIIDDEYCISTGNWTRSSFDKNREYIFCAENTSTRSRLESIFLADTQGIAWTPSDPLSELVVSPIDARQKIISFLSGAKSDMIVYVQTLTDEGIIRALEDLHRQNIPIQICTAESEANR